MSRKSRIVLNPGNVVKELRLKKGWTLKQLSEITSMAVTNLSSIENNKSRISDDRAIILATAFDVKPEFILFPNGYVREDLQNKIELVKKRVRLLEKAA